MRRYRTKRLKPPLAYEFVYLDEVATQSLTATLDGGIIQGSKESHGSQTEAGIAPTLGGHAGSVSTNLGTVSTRAVEISRQEVAESHFARLHDRLLSLRLLLVSSRPRHGIWRTEKGLWRESIARRVGGGDRLIQAWTRNRHCVDLQELRRGSLLELDVRMDEPALYNLASAVGSLAEAARNLRQLDTDISLLSEAHIGAVENMVHWLRGGMVPMSGTVTGHVVATNHRRSVIVDGGRLARLGNPHEWETKPLRVAGYCNLNCFWQHPSRVFTDGSIFRCLMRVEYPDAERAWDELDHLSIFDSFGADIRGAARAALAEMRRGHDGASSPAALSFGQILETHFERLAQETGAAGDATAVQEALSDQWALMSPEKVPVIARRSLLKKVESGFDLNAADLESLREASFLNHGRAADGTAVESAKDGYAPSPQDSALRVHFIGISW